MPTESPAIDPSVTQAAPSVALTPNVSTPTHAKTDVKPAENDKVGKSNIEAFSIGKVLGLTKPENEIKKLQKMTRDQANVAKTPFDKPDEDTADSKPSVAPKEVRNPSVNEAVPVEINNEAIVPKDDEKPEEVAPATEAPKAEETPAKVKVGGKEYTPEELEELVSRANKPKEEEANPQPKAPEAPKAKTQEELQAEAKYQRQVEENFIQQHVNAVDLSRTGLQLSEKEMDIINDGGAPAVALLNDLRKRDTLHAVLIARKSMANDINPIIEDFRNTMAPIVQQQREIAAYENEQKFYESNPDLKAHAKIVRTVAQGIGEKYPDWARQASQEDYHKAVADQARYVMREFGINAAPAANPEPVAPPHQPAQALPPAVVPKVVAKTPTVRPPAANAPGGTNGSTANSSNMSDFAKHVMGI